MSAAPAPAPQLDIVRALAVLLCCQLAGEIIVAAGRQVLPAVAFPGPVVGMALFFVFLLWRGGPGHNLDVTGSAILRNLSLLFVPAAVGVVQQGGLLSTYGLALVAAVLVSTVLTLLVTVGTFIAVARVLKVGFDEA